MCSVISFNCGDISDLHLIPGVLCCSFFHATLPDMDDDIIIIKEHYGQRALLLFATMRNGGQHCYFYLKNASMCEIIILPPGIPLSYFIRQYKKMKQKNIIKNELSLFISILLPFCFLILLLQHPAPLLSEKPQRRT